MVHVFQMAKLVHHHIVDHRRRVLHQCQAQVDVAAPGQRAPAAAHLFHPQHRQPVAPFREPGKLPFDALLEAGPRQPAPPLVHGVADGGFVVGVGHAHVEFVAVACHPRPGGDGDAEGERLTQVLAGVAVAPAHPGPGRHALLLIADPVPA